jgi:protein-S-isoprenylcysteine O-methyltransferase Ste14
MTLEHDLARQVEAAVYYVIAEALTNVTKYVQVAADQVVVRSGQYAAIRHPAYTGNLLIYAGVGPLLANWASLAALMVIPLLGLTPRIAVEEALLQARLGGPYR